MTWRCYKCGRKDYVRTLETTPSKFIEGPTVRCINCKATSEWPAEVAIKAISDALLARIAMLHKQCEETGIWEMARVRLDARLQEANYIFATCL